MRDFIPGELGSVVIAGHLDRKDGGPGVFYNLSELKRGDIIELEDVKGKKFTYRVNQVKEYDESEFPIEKVFLDKGRRKLNLITCAGVFLKDQQNYSRRLVVYSSL